MSAYHNHEQVKLPAQEAFDILKESAFHCRLLACFGTVDPDLHFCLCFFGLLTQAYFAKAAQSKESKIIKTNSLHVILKQTFENCQDNNKKQIMRACIRVIKWSFSLNFGPQYWYLTSQTNLKSLYTQMGGYRMDGP